MSDSRNRTNVIVGAPDVKASGGLQIGDLVKDTAKYPKDATTPISAELGVKPAGFVGEDGIVKTVNRDTEKIKDWNKDSVIVLETSHEVTVKLTLLEAANANVLGTVYGKDNVTIADGKITVSDSAGELPHKTWVADLNGGEGKKGRIFIPDGQVTSVGDISYVKDDVIKYEIEVECFADANGKKFYQFFDTPAGTPAAGTVSAGSES
ncbi:hypothetical protein [Corynebacterium sp. DNF00584]|uniref:phage tail tube protein n=1 Tax=Corynebacterium sp. DNF00584 TaxID=1384076 RepID=UPI000798CC0E|nr:hypothetical protein [Corynebacterium sp. DNF00584]KXB52728.1 hypothetical protein HMPREF0307_02046 [Corynebacterium sp. DNF00584]